MVNPYPFPVPLGDSHVQGGSGQAVSLAGRGQVPTGPRSSRRSRKMRGQQARDLHLGDPEVVGDLTLGQALEEPQLAGCDGPARSAGVRRAPG